MTEVPMRRFFPLFAAEEGIGYVSVDKITFTRDDEGFVRADRWPEYIALTKELLAARSDVMDVEITFRCANGGANYLIIGLSEDDNLVAQKIQQDPPEVRVLEWLEEKS